MPTQRRHPAVQIDGAELELGWARSVEWAGRRARYIVLQRSAAVYKGQPHCRLTITPPPPRFFVSVDSKEVSMRVSPLESTLAGILVSVDSKEVMDTFCGSAGDIRVYRRTGGLQGVERRRR